LAADNASGGLNDPPPLDAGCAHHNFFGTALEHGPNALQIRVEAAFGNVMGMADMIAHHWSFSTYCTSFSHHSLHYIRLGSAKAKLIVFE
jgi:hypothetical protein